MAWVYGFVILCTDGLEGELDVLAFRVGIWYRAKVFGLPFASGRKCAEVFMNTIRNLMKTRNLACGNIGRKYVKNFQYGIAVSEKITTFASQ